MHRRPISTKLPSLLSRALLTAATILLLTGLSGLAPAIAQAQTVEDPSVKTPDWQHNRKIVAIYGTPTIDGAAEKLWENAPAIQLDRIVPDATSIPASDLAEAELRAMWDGQNLYILIRATDRTLSTRNSAPWEQDSVELFIDEGQQRNRSYDDDDAQYRISAMGQITLNDKNPNKIQAQVLRTGSGYDIELAIPWLKSAPYLNRSIGFEAQLNDDPGTGRREGIRKWNLATNDAWHDPAGFGSLVLGGAPPAELTGPGKFPWSPPVTTRTAGETDSSRGTDRVPAWARDAIFYQIFTERFRNGDPHNDPTRESLEFPDVIPRSWQITPWTGQWYARAAWEQELGPHFYEDGVFHRRYGGDLQGVIDKLDYLADLGINTIYFNPVFYARSMHKYDGNSFHHIDPYFGPDPLGDLQQMAQETADPASWGWTSADRLFLELIRQAHAREIRVVIDGVFNHTGRDFFAFADIVKNQQKSPYLDWYNIRAFDDPETPENEFRYDCWWGVTTLPEFGSNAEGTDLHPAPKAYIFDATRRWMDPDGDGDPSDGIDGWRLDVANEVPNQFWRDWHQLVRRINPQTLTIAEIWEEAGDYLEDCGFSSTMNYHGFAYLAKGFLIDGRMTASQFGRSLTDRLAAHPPAVQLALQNLLDSHDTDRLASMIVNADPDREYLQPGRYDYDVGERVSPRHFRVYDVSRPNDQQRRVQRMLAVFQIGFIGPPMIYYGTESGMDGADDPCDRMPMIWDDLEYEDRTLGPWGPLDQSFPIRFDHQLHQFYRQLFQLRKELEPLRRGDFQIVLTDDSRQALAFCRSMAGQPDSRLLVVVNRGNQPVQIARNSLIPADTAKSKWNLVFCSSLDQPLERLDSPRGEPIEVPALATQIWQVTLGN